MWKVKGQSGKIALVPSCSGTGSPFGKVMHGFIVMSWILAFPSPERERFTETRMIRIYAFTDVKSCKCDGCGYWTGMTDSLDGRVKKTLHRF